MVKKAKLNPVPDETYERLTDGQEFESHDSAQLATRAFAEAVIRLAREHGIAAIWLSCGAYVGDDDAAGHVMCAGDDDLLYNSAPALLAYVLEQAPPKQCDCAKCEAGRAAVNRFFGREVIKPARMVH